MNKKLFLMTALFAGTMIISNDICAGNEFYFGLNEYDYAKILFNLRKNAQPNGYQRTQDQHEQSEVNDQQGQRTHKRIRKRTRAQMMGSNDLQKEGTLKRTHDKSSDDQEIIDITLSDDQEIVDITSFDDQDSKRQELNNLRKQLKNQLTQYFPEKIIYDSLNPQINALYEVIYDKDVEELNFIITRIMPEVITLFNTTEYTNFSLNQKAYLIRYMFLCDEDSMDLFINSIWPICCKVIQSPEYNLLKDDDKNLIIAGIINSDNFNVLNFKIDNCLSEFLDIIKSPEYNLLKDDDKNRVLAKCFDTNYFIIKKPLLYFAKLVSDNELTDDVKNNILETLVSLGNEQDLDQKVLEIMKKNHLQFSI